MAAAKNVQQSSLAPLFILAGVVLTGLGIWHQLPGFLALWLSLVVSAFAEPPALLTGPKVAGRPQPLDESEDARMESFQFWRQLRWAMFPGPAWWFGWPPRLSWFVALTAGAAVWHLPAVVPDAPDTNPAVWPVLNAVALFATINGVNHAKRKNTQFEGIHFGHMGGGKAIWSLIAGLIGAGAGFGASIIIPQITGNIPALAEQGLSIERSTTLIAALVSFGLFSGIGLGLRGSAMAHWREVYARRKEWLPRWRQIKQIPEPYLVDSEHVGPFVVDTFEARGSSTDLLKIGETKITPTIGAGYKIGYLTAPNLKAGQPVPGTVHPNRFIVAQCESDQWPDTRDPEVPEDVRLLAARTEWQPRWKSLKADPGPELMETTILGSARIDTFAAPGHLGSAFFIPLTEKINPLVGAEVKPVVLPVWEHGVKHPTNFRIVQWSGPVELKPGEDEELMRLWIESNLMWELEDQKMGVPIVDSMELLSEEPVLWRVNLDFPEGPNYKTLREGLIGSVANELQMYSLVSDDYSAAFDPAWYLGDHANADVDSRLRKHLDEVADEDRWGGVWLAALKQGRLPPTLQHKGKATKRLSPGVEVHRYVFAPLQGLDPQEFFGLEPKLSTSLAPAPFLTITGMQLPKGRPGERHTQVFAVYHSEKPVPPSPDQLVATEVDRMGESASKWVIRGMINGAFRAAKYEQPEVVNVRCLTAPGSKPSIWEVEVRLYGGKTLADIRTIRERLRQSLNAEWLRIGPYEHGVTIYMGADPSRARLANPKRTQPLIDDLNWTQAFVDAGVTSRSGLLPTLTSSDTMPKNTDVQVLEFELPPGLSLADVREKVDRLRSAVGCEFISPTPVAGDANKMTIIAAKADPMPRSVPYDYDTVRDSKAVPFGQGVDGEPVEYNWKNSPHLLVSGGSGSGKSATMQMLSTGALVRGAELFIGDPMKGAADFKFLEPWARSITVTIADTAAMMRGVYAEVERRRNLNSQYGVGSYRDLPDDVKPKHLVVLVDEFTSLIELDKSVGRQSLDDPEMEEERLRGVAENAERTAIGQLTGKIAREARSAGVTLWLGAQKLTSKSLDAIPGGDSLKINMARMLLGVTTFGERMSALRLPEFAPDLGTDVPIGRGMYESSVAAAVAVHCYYDGSDKLANFLRSEGVSEAEPFDLAPFTRKREDDGPAIKSVELDLFNDTDEAETVVDEGFSLDTAEVAGDGGLDLSALVVGWTPPDDGDSGAPVDDPFAEVEVDDPFAEQLPAVDDPFAEQVPDDPFEDDGDFGFSALLDDSTDNSVEDSTEDSTDDSVEESTDDSVEDSTDDSVEDSTDDSVEDSTDDSVEDSTDDWGFDDPTDPAEDPAEDWGFAESTPPPAQTDWSSDTW